MIYAYFYGYSIVIISDIRIIHIIIDCQLLLKHHKLIITFMLDSILT